MDIKVVSLSRCGQHAFCNWLCKQIGECYFWNIFGGININGDIESNVTNKDYYPGLKNKYTRVELHENKELDTNSSIRLVLLRDPYNWISSLTNVHDRSNEQMNVFISRYIELAKEPGIISYNDWFSNQDYRRKICKTLNLDFTDDGLQDVLIYGDGSSFDKRSMDGRAQQMKVLERWKIPIEGKHKYLSKKQYINIFNKNPELDEIAKTSLFGMERPWN